MNADAGEAAREPREPSFLDALAPVVVMIGLLVLTIVLFGVDAATGPLQVALFASAVFAGLIAMKNGHTSARLRNAMIGGVSSAMGAIFILLAVGALIGTWNMAGTIPTVVSYGIAVLKPSIFYAAVALICAVVGAVTGSSWTTGRDRSSRRCAGSSGRSSSPAARPGSIRSDTRSFAGSAWTTVCAG